MIYLNFYNFFIGSDTLANLFTHEVINNSDPSPEDRVTAICQLADNVIFIFISSYYIPTIQTRYLCS